MLRRMPPTQLEDLEASIRELEAQLPSAAPEMRALLATQIDALRSAGAMLRGAQPQIDELKKLRPALSPEIAGFFTPAPPVEVPAWVPDAITRPAVSPELLRCPPGAQMYWAEESVGCAVPRGAGRIPIREGLELRFHSTGRLQSQRFYEADLLRWSIEYHATGGRASVGFYVAREPKTYPEHGLHTRFAPNGTITSQATYEAGAQHGWSRIWDDDGYPIGATLYDHGTAVESLLPDGTRRPA